MKDEQKTKPLISEMEDPRSNLMAIRKILISYAKITINGESILFFFFYHVLLLLNIIPIRRL